MAQALRKMTLEKENDNSYRVKTTLSANQTSTIDSTAWKKKLTHPSTPTARRRLSSYSASGQQAGKMACPSF